MFSRVDLHVHSTASDGKCTPKDIVAKAAALGLSAIAITDHDTVAGLRGAQAAGKLYGVQVIPGIELSTQHEQVEVHVLGYFINAQKRELVAKLEILSDARRKRALAIWRRLQREEIPIDWSQIQKHAAGDIIGRAHIARALVEIGYVPTTQKAFDYYLNPGCPAYVPRYKLTPEEAIRLIHICGGAAVLAHPGLLPDRSYLEPLLKLNWQGMEIYHPDHSQKIKSMLKDIAQRKKLICTGGSDFHGNKSSRRKLGACTVDESIVERLRESCPKP